MTDFIPLLQQGWQAWLFLPTALLLGALHGLEPGHSKTLMAAFIVAVRGTPAQAALLGVSAALSHSLVVWAVALTGLYLGERYPLAAQTQLLTQVSGLIIMGVALWMLVPMLRASRLQPTHSPVQLRGLAAPAKPLAAKPQPFSVQSPPLFRPVAQPMLDAHGLAHAKDIKTRFATGKASCGQIILFGLTGGLLPCPAAITVLLLCIQAQRFTLGVTLVAGFSLGLACTLVASGVLAALSIRHVKQRWAGAERWLQKAPYASAVLMLAVGAWMFWGGFHAGV